LDHFAGTALAQTAGMDNLGRARQRMRWMGIGALIIFARCGHGPTAPTAGPSSPGTTPEATYSVSDFVAGVTTVDGMAATMRPGAAPQPNGGPSVVSPPTHATTVVSPGSTVVRLSAPQSFELVYLSVGNVPKKVGGFWQLQLPSPATDLLLVVKVSGQVPSPTFDLTYAVSSQTGVVGPYSDVRTNVIRGTSDLEISVWWDQPSDVDLNVIEPSGEEVYWGNNISASGGMLDQDSNIDCQIDNKNNESIRWTAAPSGTYIVRLDYSSSCGIIGDTKYVVAVNHKGTTELFQGVLSGSGSNGATGQERAITSVTHTGGGGPTPVVTNRAAPLAPRSGMKRRLPAT
jgi:hypothetical protein